MKETLRWENPDNDHRCGARISKSPVHRREKQQRKISPRPFGDSDSTKLFQHRDHSTLCKVIRKRSPLYLNQIHDWFALNRRHFHIHHFNQSWFQTMLNFLGIKMFFKLWIILSSITFESNSHLNTNWIGSIFWITTSVNLDFFISDDLGLLFGWLRSQSSASWCKSANICHTVLWFHVGDLLINSTYNFGIFWIISFPFRLLCHRITHIHKKKKKKKKP
jgi:hypothetical protein